MTSPQHLDVIVAGAGFAGLTAATLAAQDGLATLVLDRMGVGGKLINLAAIENYPGAPEGTGGATLAARVAEQALDAGAQTRTEEVLALEPGSPHRVVTAGGAYSAPVVILALGADLARLGIPGEAEFEGRGVSYCATCDADFFAGQPVAVVGGGDSGADEALYLAEIASEVHVVFQEPALHAVERWQRRLREHPRVRLVPATRAIRIEGDDGGMQRLVLASADGDGERALAVNGVFVCAGLPPNSALLRGVVPLDAAGHVETDGWMRTAVPGVFAIGDLRARSPKLLATAAGDAALAAVAAAQYLGRREGPAARWREA